MIKYSTKKNLLVYIVPVLAALTVRLILLINWWDSPVRWYCSIGGLDMKSVLEIGFWSGNGQSVFTLPEALVALTMLFNNGIGSPEAIVIIQLLGGIIVTSLTAWCTLRIWGNIYWAMFSGILSALYAPALMYQVLVLKESVFLLFALLSLTAVLWAHKKHFNSISLWVCGIFMALACVCRINALPFCGLAALWIAASLFHRFKAINKKVLLKGVFLVLGILTVFIPVSIVNSILTDGNRILPFHLPRVKYIAKVGSVASPKDLGTVPQENTKQKNPSLLSSSPSIIRKGSNFALNMLRKIPQIFSASEIPNNVNYYFLKYKLFPLEYMVGPLLLIPLAVTGLLLLILNRSALRKESILFVFIIAYMLPICVFVPLARYKLVLMPVFCMLAPYPLFIARKAWCSDKQLTIILPLLAWVMILGANLPVNSFLRSSDFICYGKGMEFKTGQPAAALPWFLEAYKMAPDKQMNVVNLSETLLKLRKPREAAKILIPAYKKSPDNTAYKYYLGTALLYSGRPHQAATLFSRIKPDNMGNLKVQYYYYYGESLRVQKKFKTAAEFYRKALSENPTAKQRILLEKSLGACNGN